MSLQKVAEHAGVSIATVSRVVNGSEAVKGATRKRVLAALKELNYTPNLYARNLVSGQSNLFGMIVSNLTNPFFADLYHQLETFATRAGFELLLANTNYDEARFANALKLMVGRRVEGIAIAVSAFLPPETARLIAAQIPVVCFNTGNGIPGVTRIRLDARKGLGQLVDYLHSLGHRKLAYIGHSDHFETTLERKDTFIERARAHDMEYTTLNVLRGDSWEEGRDAVRRLISLGFDASGIVCVNDITAVGVLRELKSQNISVPDDVSVTGFDNVSVGQFSCPSLTTAVIPRDQIAEIMFKILTKEAPVRDDDYGVETDIIIRESTGPYRGRGIISAQKA